MKRFLVILLLCALLTGTAVRYILRERGGMVCVYDAQSGIWQDTGCPAASLPHTARAELLRGLTFSSPDTLTRALEAYCS